MKSLSILIGCCITAFSLFAQNTTVTVTLNGNLNKQVYVDGINYPLTIAATNSSSRANTAIIENLAAGQHTLQVLNANQTAGNRRNEKIFNVRQGYNLAITVNANGNLTLSESRIRRRGNNNNTGSQVAAMTQANFNTLYQDIRSRYQSGSRVAALNSTFNNTSNYFTTAQVRQLLQLVGGDASRLPLAKASYRSVVDPTNFSSLYNLLATQASRNDLVLYVRNYSPQGYPGNTTGNPNYNQAMTDVNFRTVYNDIQSRWQMGSKISGLNTIFTTAGNYFSTTQVGQLLQLITDENEQFQLAKVAYRTVVDPSSFTSIINSFSTQARRDELAYYVRNFNPANPGGGYTYGGGSVTSNQEMSNSNFRSIYNDIQSRWQMGSKISGLNTIFTTAGNYLSTTQVGQLLQLITDENERFQLAKVSYRTVIDPTNFSSIINSFSTQARRDELAYYVRTYDPSNPGAGYNYNGSVTTNQAMTETNFNTLYENIRRQWIPGAKKAAVLEAFANTSNYFTSSQARLLVSLDNNENNRMDMAKASLRSIVDPANFSVVYDLFTNQAARDELAAYARNTGASANSTNTPTNTLKTAMSESNFNTLYEDIRRQWLPGAKKSAVLTAFSNSNYYFSTAQVIRLVSLDNDEPDRLDMAKASLRSITDPGNIRQLVDIFTNQSYKDDLTNYINNYR